MYSVNAHYAHVVFILKKPLFKILRIHYTGNHKFQNWYLILFIYFFFLHKIMLSQFIKNTVKVR